MNSHFFFQRKMHNFNQNMHCTSLFFIFFFSGLWMYDEGTFTPLHNHKNIIINVYKHHCHNIKLIPFATCSIAIISFLKQQNNFITIFTNKCNGIKHGTQKHIEHVNNNTTIIPITIQYK